MLEKVGFLLSEQPPADWSSCLEKMCGENEVDMEKLYPKFTLGPLVNLLLEVSRLLETWLR